MLDTYVAHGFKMLPLIMLKDPCLLTEGHHGMHHFNKRVLIIACLQLAALLVFFNWLIFEQKVIKLLRVIHASHCLALGILIKMCRCVVWVKDVYLFSFLLAVFIILLLRPLKYERLSFRKFMHRLLLFVMVLLRGFVLREVNKP